MNPRLDALAAILRLNHRLYRNALDGVDDALARRRAAGANPIVFVAAHVLDARFAALDLLNAPFAPPLRVLLAGMTGPDDMADRPTVAELRDGWDAVCVRLDARLAQLADADLDAPVSRRLPGSDGSLLGALTFLAQHESHHIGQLGLLRRQHGLAALRFD